MKAQLLYPLQLILLLLINPLAPNELKDSMDLMKEESKEFAENQRKLLQKKLDTLKPHQIQTMQDDILPLEDKGKQFNPPLDEKALENNSIPPAGSEIQTLLSTSPQKEKPDTAEEFLLHSKNILENPKGAIGVIQEEKQIIPEEKKLETCIEKGFFQFVVTQKRTVHFTPEEKEQVKYCLGHTRHKTFSKKKKPRKNVTKKDKNSLQMTRLPPILLQ